MLYLKLDTPPGMPVSLKRFHTQSPLLRCKRSEGQIGPLRELLDSSDEEAA